MKIIRLFGGLIFGAGALFFVVGGIVMVISDNGMNAFAGVFSLGIGVFLGRFAVYCFNPKYADDTAKRHLRG